MKRHESLRHLSREHHSALILARLLRKDAPPYKGLPQSPEGKALYACELFNGQLIEHFQQEEKIFTTLTPFHPSISEMLATIRQEHQELIQLFSDLAAGNFNVDSLNKLGLYLESHIRKEERSFFPFLESNCPDSALKALLKNQS